VIKVENLRKRYPGAEQPALDGLSLNVPAGLIYGLLGPNGAGKTTLMSMLTGLIAKDAGSVHIAGLDLDHERAAIRGQLGYVPQQLAFYPTLTVAENLRTFAELTASTPARLEFCIETAQLAAQLKKPAQALSGGLQRRLNLAIGLLGQPRLLLLDEPTSGVDPQARHFLLETVRKLRDGGLTVLYTSHLMEEVQRLCDRVAIIDRGRLIAEGTLPELLGKGDRDLEALFLRLTDHALRDAA
jgi:ABC-2 type transport system ATP-binding protein